MPAGCLSSCSVAVFVAAHSVTLMISYPVSAATVPTAQYFVHAMHVLSLFMRRTQWQSPLGDMVENVKSDGWRAEGLQHNPDRASYRVRLSNHFLIVCASKTQVTGGPVCARRMRCSDASRDEWSPDRPDRPHSAGQVVLRFMAWRESLADWPDS